MHLMYFQYSVSRNSTYYIIDLYGNLFLAKYPLILGQPFKILTHLPIELKLTIHCYLILKSLTFAYKRI